VLRPACAECGRQAKRLGHKTGASADARKDLEKSLELTAPDSYGRAWALLQLGLTCNKLKDYPAARKHLEEARRINKKVKNLTLEDRSKINKILRSLPAAKPKQPAD